MPGPLARLLAWYLHTPPDISRADARIYAGAKFGYTAGILIHSFAAVVFFALGLPVLGVYNVVATFLGAVFFGLHLAGRPGIGFIGINIENAVGVCLVTVYTGLAPGFFLFALVGPLYAPLVTFISVPARVCAVVGTSILFVGLLVLGIVLPPLTPLPLFWEIFFAAMNGVSLVFLVLSVIMTYRTAVDRAESALEAEYEKSEALLHNIMPPSVAARLKENPKVIADSHKPVTILFADIVGFTDMAGRSTPEDLVSLLNNVFSRFDELVEDLGLEKIKTIGDAYMVVAGLPEARDDHAHAIARLALDMVAATEGVSRETGERLQIRVGINTGEVVAGVIGQRKFAYDLWGDTVNVAARMESTGVAGRIQLSPEAAELLTDEFEIEPRGEVDVKGKGMMPVYFLTREKAGSARATG